MQNVYRSNLYSSSPSSHVCPPKCCLELEVPKEQSAWGDVTSMGNLMEVPSNQCSLDNKTLHKSEVSDFSQLFCYIVLGELPNLSNGFGGGTGGYGDKGKVA